MYQMLNGDSFLGGELAIKITQSNFICLVEKSNHSNHNGNLPYIYNHEWKSHNAIIVGHTKY